MDNKTLIYALLAIVAIIVAIYLLTLSSKEVDDLRTMVDDRERKDKENDDFNNFR